MATIGERRPYPPFPILWGGWKLENNASFDRPYTSAIVDKPAVPRDGPKTFVVILLKNLEDVQVAPELRYGHWFGLRSDYLLEEHAQQEQADADQHDRAPGREPFVQCRSNQARMI